MEQVISRKDAGMMPLDRLTGRLLRILLRLSFAPGVGAHIVQRPTL